MKRVLQILVLLTSSVTGVVLWINRTPSRDSELASMLAARQRESYEIVSSSEDKLIRALFTGAIRLGSDIEAATSIETPVWTETFGTYAVHGFDEQGYSYRTIVTHNGKAIRAGAGSCTWEWTFFDNLPEPALAAISHVQCMRKYLAKHPEFERRLTPLIQEQLLSLE